MPFARLAGAAVCLAAAVAACSTAGRAAYPHLYNLHDGPVVFPDPTDGAWAGAAVGVLPGLLGHRVRVSARVFWAAAGAAAGLVALAGLIVLFNEVVYTLHPGSYRAVEFGPYSTWPPLMVRYGLLPAVVFGGLAGWFLSGRRDRGGASEGAEQAEPLFSGTEPWEADGQPVRQSVMAYH